MSARRRAAKLRKPLPAPTKNPLPAAGFFMAQKAIALAPRASQYVTVFKWKVLAWCPLN
jgi:hypothetical protein